MSKAIENSLYSSKYGSVPEIIDQTNIHILKDSEGNDFVCEVYPVNIKETDIQEMLGMDENRWMIRYMSEIEDPSQEQINQAISSGSLLILSKTIKVIDNYGMYHNLSFDKQTGRYSNPLMNHVTKIKAKPLNNVFIDYIQNTEDYLPSMFPTSVRVLYDIIQSQQEQFMQKIMERLDKMKDMVGQFEQRITKLEMRG